MNKVKKYLIHSQNKNFIELEEITEQPVEGFGGLLFSQANAIIKKYFPDAVNEFYLNLRKMMDEAIAVKQSKSSVQPEEKFPIEFNKPQPQTNKERIEVDGIWGDGYKNDNIGGYCKFSTNRIFQHEKYFPLIKQAIEKILNNEK